MLIVALVMAVIGLAALVTAVVTSNEVIAWVCIGASVIGVVLLIVDAVRERQRSDTTAAHATGTEPAEEHRAQDEEFDAEYPEDATADEPEHPATEKAQRTQAADPDARTQSTAAESEGGPVDR